MKSELLTETVKITTGGECACIDTWGWTIIIFIFLVALTLFILLQRRIYENKRIMKRNENLRKQIVELKYLKKDKKTQPSPLKMQKNTISTTK
jgi:hypothetical protein